MPQLVAVAPAMHGFPSRRKPFDNASAASCDEAALRAEWMLMLSVNAVWLHAGKGGEVASNGGAVVVADADGNAGAVDGGDDVAPPAQGAGARAHVGGSKAAASAAVAGVAGC